MSLLRRKRRQNRIELRTIPATREARSSLATPTVQGWRNIFGRKLAEQRKSNRLEDLSLPNFQRLKRLDNLPQVRRFKEIMSQGPKPLRIRKPVSTIQLNGVVRVDLPPEHPICIKREQRREMMFATGKAGKGGQRPRKQQNIQLRCK